MNEFKSRYLLLFLGVFLLNISDTIATYAAVSGGFAYEANPAMAWLISSGGWISFALVKVIIAAAFVGLYWKYLLWHLKPIVIGSYVIGGLYFAVNLVHLYGLIYILGA